MTTAVTLFGDARAEVIGVLADAVSAATASYVDGVNVAGRLPTGPLEPPRIYVLSDGATDTITGAVQRVTVRVAAVHNTDADSHDLAQWAQAVLLANTGSVDQLAACHPGTGPFDDVDPLNPVQPMSWFTVAVTMRGRVGPA